MPSPPAGELQGCVPSCGPSLCCVPAGCGEGGRGGALGWEMLAQTPGMLCSACAETLLVSGVRVARICCICDGIRHLVPQCQQPCLCLCWKCSVAKAWAGRGQHRDSLPCSWHSDDGLLGLAGLRGYCPCPAAPCCAWAEEEMPPRTVGGRDCDFISKKFHPSKHSVMI